MSTKMRRKLNPLKEDVLDYRVPNIGLIKGDTGSLDCSSYGPCMHGVPIPGRLWRLMFV